MSRAGADAPATGLLSARPTLRTTDALGQSLNIGPIVSVGLSMFLIAAAAGAATPFVIAVVFGGSLALAWTVSLYARRYAGAGAVYEYVARAHGQDLGLLAAASYFLPTLFLNGSALVTSLLFQAFATEHLSFDPGWWTGGVVAICLAIALSWRGVRISVAAVLALTLLSAIPLLVTAIAIVIAGGAAGNTLSVFDPASAPGGGLFNAVLFGILIFIGFESAACTGEEVRLPHRAIPRTLLLSVGIAGAFFLLMSYAATIGFGPANASTEWGGNPTAFSALGDRYVGEPTSALIAAAIVIDALAVQLAATNLLSRGYFALARDGFLPRLMARTSRFETPVGGLMGVALGSLVVLGAAAAFEQKFDLFEITATALVLTVLPTFLVLALGSPRLLTGRRRLLQVPIALAAATVPALGIYGSFDPAPTGLRIAGVALAGASFAALGGWYASLRRNGRRPLDRVASHALVTERA